MNVSDDFRYEKADGSLVKRQNVIQEIKELLEQGPLICPDIAKILTMNEKQTHYILRHMVATNYLLTKKTQRWTYYSLPNKCLLEEILKPNNKEFVRLSKKHRGRVHKLCDFNSKKHDR